MSELPIHPVNPDSPVPLYHQVENDLENLIKSGVLEPDDLLPPELELSKVYGVGRQTVRMALARLVTNRLIERRAGRGTVILPEPERKSFYLDRSFTRQLAEMGMTTYSRVLQAAPGEITANAPKSLRHQIGARCFYLVRLRYGNDQPIGLQYTTIMAARCPDLARWDFSRESLYDVLSKYYMLTINKITHTVTALTANEEQATLLAIEPGDTLLQVTTTAYLENREVIEASLSYYRTDRYEFSITETL
ncbi:MAG: GntR family transcriptional regulator [Anaerolineae bacterium]|nr:GntR family transcriptional regulator [Anaerolineae bacterium]